MNNRFDTIVLGSGFGGSLLATILAKFGQRVAIVDERVHPRFAIGESSTPAADFILHDLATEHDLDELIPLCRFGSWRETYPKIRCGCKRGFSYFWHGGPRGYQPTNDHANELFVAANRNREVADTQWYRQDVDQFFFRMALNSDVIGFESTKIAAIEHLGDHDWRLQCSNGNGELNLDANFLIDATGPAGVLLDSLKIRDDTSKLHTDTSCLYSHFENVPTMEQWLKQHDVDTSDFPFPADDSAVHHVSPEGWLWQLRFKDGPTSLGFVSPRSSRPQLEYESFAKMDWLPTDLFGGATLSNVPGKIVRTGRLQRLREQGAGADWAALPFTIGFIDPLHSTGIAHTLSGVQRLAEILTKATPVPSEKLARYSRDVIQELLLIDKLVAGNYIGLSDFRLFTSWSMLYFACATSFEKSYLAGDRDFLCAGSSQLRSIIDELFEKMQTLGQRRDQGGVSSTEIEQFQNQVRERIAPFNQVGLFSPEIPNMYAYTAAEK